MKKICVSVMCLFALIMMMLSACGQMPDIVDEAKDNAISIVDMAGREVKLDAPAERVVALTAADCEILCAIGAQDAIVGRGEYCDYPETILDVPSVQSGYETNIEQIIALKPEVIFMSMMDQTKEQGEMLEKAGIRVVNSYETDIEGVYCSIRNIGAVMGRSEQAEALISQMQEEFDSVSRDSMDGKKVYFEVSPLEYGLWTAGSGTFMNELAEMMGLENIFADVEGWAEVSEEQVIERSPDYIVTITMYYGDGPTPEEEIMSRAGWQEINAVRNGAVFNAVSDEISRPGPRLADAALALYDFVYGGE